MTSTEPRRPPDLSISAEREAMDRFFATYFALDPVTATFTGFHDFDDALPDWSPAGLELAAHSMDARRRELKALGVGTTAAQLRDTPIADRSLADAHLEIRLAEQAGGHFHRGNPALWTGEAIFSLVSLAARTFAPVARRMQAATARMRDIPHFLGAAAATIGTRPVPSAWTERAVRECAAADVLLGRGVETWIREEPHVADDTIARLRVAATAARAAFSEFATWLRGVPAAPPGQSSCGVEFLEVLLRRGHWCTETRGDLLAEARDGLAEAEAKLGEMARAVSPDGWAGVQELLADDHPSAAEYLETFGREWDRCRALAESARLVTWADRPMRFSPVPEFARGAAPSLYFLNYRSPAPFERTRAHDHFVPPLDPAMPPEQQERLLRATNRAVIRLNHIVHHAALGHHVQNDHAARSGSRIGRIAAVDGASRLAMFSGGTMAEGWACYAVDLAEEIGFLSTLECVSQQHTRVRILCRAVVDLAFHGGAMTLDEAIAFYVEHAMLAEGAARAEAVKNSMFPGAAVMYWLGARAIHALRAERSRAAGSSFTLRSFHDELLSYGAIPLSVVATLMSANRAT